MGATNSASPIRADDDDWTVIPSTGTLDLTTTAIPYTAVFKEAIDQQDLTTDPDLDPFVSFQLILF